MDRETTARIKTLYQRFPDAPAQFHAWMAEVGSLWGGDVRRET